MLVRLVRYSSIRPGPGVSPSRPLEHSILDEADAEETHLRLSCQIKVTDALDGLVVRVATKQY